MWRNWCWTRSWAWFATLSTKGDSENNRHNHHNDSSKDEPLVLLELALTSIITVGSASRLIRWVQKIVLGLTQFVLSQSLLIAGSRQNVLIFLFEHTYLLINNNNREN